MPLKANDYHNHLKLKIKAQICYFLPFEALFFEKKEEVKVEEINALCKELVEKSLKDNGNIAYDYFTSGIRNGVMMICETWENEEVLKAHMASEHFTTLVPKIEALTKNGLKLEQFTF